MENLININCLKKAAEKEKVFFNNDGSIKNKNQVFSNLLYYYFNEKENHFYNINFYDCSINDDNDGSIEIFVENENFVFNFNDDFFNIIEPENYGLENYKNVFINYCTKVLENKKNNYYLNCFEILLKNKNYIINFLNAFYNIYFLLVYIFENGDKNNIFENNQNFVNYCLMMELNF